MQCVSESADYLPYFKSVCKEAGLVTLKSVFSFPKLLTSKGTELSFLKTDYFELVLEYEKTGSISKLVITMTVCPLELPLKTLGPTFACF